MIVPAAARDAQSRLSRRAVELLDCAALHPEAQRPEDFSGYDLPSLVEVFPYPVHAWPTILAGARLEELRRATVQIPLLLASTFEKIFERDPRRILQFYGWNDPDLAEFLLREPSGMFTALTRSDFLDSPTGFKCLEVNASARLGGWHLRCYIDQLYYQKPWLRELLTRPGAPAVYIDPLHEMFEYLIEEGLRTGACDGRQMNIAFILVSAEELRRTEHYYRDYLRAAYAAYREHFHPGLGGDILFGRYEQIREFGGRVWLGDARLDALLEFGLQSDPKALRVFKRGGVNVYDGPAAIPLGDKRGLALLSEHENSERFTAEERELIRRHIPWTRVARLGTTDFRGERVDLAELAMTRRESLILKDSHGMAGRNVVVGRDTPPPAWRQAIVKAFHEGQWIFQERVEPVSYWYQHGDGEIAPFDVIWGTFGFGPRYGGGFLRIQPSGRANVINSAQGAIQAMYLEIEEGDL
ncbi:MAG TPA: hypothetical protein VHU81_08535 [Thermoanaerobaculia bacterium]|nr:hypothetical protein [Thermoanaerobaculia bacterium]